MRKLTNNLEIVECVEGYSDTPALKVVVNGFPLYCWDDTIEDSKLLDDILSIVKEHDLKSIVVDISKFSDNWVDTENNDVVFLVWDLADKFKTIGNVWVYTGMSRNDFIAETGHSVMREGVVFVFGKYEPEHASFDGNLPKYRKSFNQTIWKSRVYSRFFMDVTHKFDPNYTNWLNNQSKD